MAALRNIGLPRPFSVMIAATKQAVGATKSLAVTLLLMTNSCTNSLLRGY